MNKKQSIISAIVTFILIFIAPRLSSKGIELDEATATTIVTGIIAILAWAWASWKNHNYTDEAVEYQLLKKEDRIQVAEIYEEFDDDEEEGEE